MYDVIIVGAGPAGLNAALVLGRCRRGVLVLDDGHPRNASSRALHGFFTRDGTDPREMLALGREELGRYPTVEIRAEHASDARREDNRFTLTLATGEEVESAFVLLATGVVDELPPVPGIEAFYGRSVHHCPYCDGWEHSDEAIAVYGDNEPAVDLALELTAWSRGLALVTDGPARLSQRQRKRLREQDIAIYEQRIERLRGQDGTLEAIAFADGTSLTCGAIFFRGKKRQRSDLAERLGCVPDETGMVPTGKYEATDIPGLFIAGDAARSIQLAIIAASEGASAAVLINDALIKRDLARYARHASR